MLIVDDDVAVRPSFRRALQHVGLSVPVAVQLELAVHDRGGAHRVGLLEGAEGAALEVPMAGGYWFGRPAPAHEWA